MPTRSHTLADASRFLAWLVLELGRELRLARHEAGLRQQDVADRLGWSKCKVSRIERGLSRHLAVDDLIDCAAVVGLRPSVRLWPLRRALRDAGQVELLAALSRRMHPRWQTSQEVPMPHDGDLRAADQLSVIPGCRLMIEAYRRFFDSQAQVRSARRKQRDLGADRLLLLIEDTHANRRAVAEVGEPMRREFPVPARAFLAALAAGRDPGGDGIVPLRRERPQKPTPVAPRETKGERVASQPLPVPPGATGRE